MTFQPARTLWHGSSRARIAVAALLIGGVCRTPHAQSQSLSERPLITRDRVALNLAGAELIIQVARQNADTLNLKVNIAVVDDGGHLLAFARMDGARPASGYTALTKAVAAATFRQATGPLPAGGELDVLLNLSLQHAATASGGKLTTLKGGVPIEYEGHIIGAVGIGGGTGEQDAELARTGIQALLDQLKRQ